MKQWMTTLLMLTFAVMVAGCAQMTGTPAADGESQPAEPQAGAARLGDAMLQGLQKHSYRDFTRNFSADLRQSTPEAKFQKLCADLSGKHDQVSEWKLLDTLERGGIYRTELWKVTVSRKTKDGDNQIDRVFYVTTATIDGKAAVIGFKFDTLF